jgi:hypothetical protein
MHGLPTAAALATAGLVTMTQQIQPRAHKNAPDKHQQPRATINPAIIHCPVGKALHRGGGGTAASKQAIQPPCLPKQFHSTKYSQEPSGSLPSPQGGNHRNTSHKHTRKFWLAPGNASRRAAMHAATPLADNPVEPLVCHSARPPTAGDNATIHSGHQEIRHPRLIHAAFCAKSQEAARTTSQTA